MMKKILCTMIIMAFCTLQYAPCVCAATSSNNYGIQMSPIPTGYTNTAVNSSVNNNSGNYTPSVNFTNKQNTQQAASVSVQTTTTSSSLGKGKVLKAFLQNDVSTTDAVKGDPIVVVLSENWYENGQVIAEAGSVINGIISSANSAGSWSKDGALQIDFTSMETPNGEVYGLTAEKIDIQVEKEKHSKWKAAGKVAGTVLAAAAVGAVFGLLGDGNGVKSTTTTTTTGNSTTTSSKTTRNKEYGRDAAKGAAVGATAGVLLGIAAIGFKQGNNITIPANTNFEILLLEDIKKQSY